MGHEDSADESELVADLIGVLEELVDQGHLEVASRRGLHALAPGLLRVLETKPSTVADWLVDCASVSELYLDSDELRPHFQRVLDRMHAPYVAPKHHPELAAAVAEAPDDPRQWHVYADWLHEHGDPRGELMSLQLEREGKHGAELERLEQRERVLIARHRRHIYGDFRAADDNGPELSLRFGFFDEADLPDRAVHGESAHEALEALLDLESSRFLRKLAVRSVSLDALGSVLAKKPLPSTLVDLEIGPVGNRFDARMIGAKGTLNLNKATRGLHRLERLVVCGWHFVAGELALPRLRRLSIGAQRLRMSQDALTSAPVLEELELDVDEAEGLEALDALLAAPPATLTSLAVRGLADTHGRGPALVASLLRSQLPRWLRSLDLSGNGLGDADATRLLEASPHMQTVERFCLRDNELSEPIRAQLDAAWPNVDFAWHLDVDDFEGDDDDERYDGIRE